MFPSLFQVNNNAATGSTALLLASQLVRGGASCVMALGFDKMERGSISAVGKVSEMPDYMLLKSKGH